MIISLKFYADKNKKTVQNSLLSQNCVFSGENFNATLKKYSKHPINKSRNKFYTYFKDEI